MQAIMMPLGLVALGVVLIVLEAFIPSAGVLAVLAAISLIAGVIYAFVNGGLYVGAIFMVTSTGFVAGLIAWMIRTWPSTPLGRMILVEPAAEEELLPDRSEYEQLVGRVGQAESVMLPGGFVELEGKRYEAMADKAVEKDTWVEVVRVKNGRTLVVRAVSAEEALRSQQTIANEREPLSAPIDDVIPDPFRDS